MKPAEGISRAIFAAADGKKLKKCMKAIGHCPIGHAVVTPSCGLPCRFTIHTAGAGWYSGRDNEDVFRDCCRHALQKACALRCRSVALPLMFSGSLHITREGALLIVRSVVEEFEMVYPGMEISLVLWKESIYSLAERILQRRNWIPFLPKL